MMLTQIKTNTYLKLFFILCFILLNTGCGFHPRGSVPFAPELQRVYLKTPSPYSELTNNLRDYLEMSGVYLADTPTQANTILEIVAENMVQELLGVSGSQQTRQYKLTLSVTFQVTSPTDVILVSRETLSQSRILPINSGEVLAGSNQAAALYQQMRRAIVFDIMNRLSSREITHKLTSFSKNNHENSAATIRTTTQ